NSSTAGHATANPGTGEDPRAAAREPSPLQLLRDQDAHVVAQDVAFQPFEPPGLEAALTTAEQPFRPRVPAVLPAPAPRNHRSGLASGPLASAPLHLDLGLDRHHPATSRV